MVLRRSAAAALLALAVAAAPSQAAPRKSYKKGVWGPAEVAGVSQFPIYQRLGAGIWATRLRWASVALRRPAHPRNPADPAYVWPAGLDDAVRQARRSGIRVAM